MGRRCRRALQSEGSSRLLAAWPVEGRAWARWRPAAQNVAGFFRVRRDPGTYLKKVMCQGGRHPRYTDYTSPCGLRDWPEVVAERRGQKTGMESEEKVAETDRRKPGALRPSEGITTLDALR